MSFLSSTQLSNFRLSDLHVDFNDEWLRRDVADHCEESYEVAPDFEVFGSPEDEDVLIRLSVTCKPSQDLPGICRFDEVRATVWGLMHFGVSTDREERGRLAFMNGPVMLHGLLRGVISAATGSCVGGPFILPTVNYVRVLQAMGEQLQLPDAEDTDTKDIVTDGTDEQA